MDRSSFLPDEYEQEYQSLREQVRTLKREKAAMLEALEVAEIVLTLHGSREVSTKARAAIKLARGEDNG